MRIHQHKDKSYTLDQHRYVLNTLQRYNPISEFPERETPFPPDYTFSKDNRPVTDHDKHIIEEQHKRLPFRSAVCTLLYLAYNTRADILFAVCKLAKACICPGETDFRALIWLIAIYDDAHTMPSSSTQTLLPILSTMYAANTAYHTQT